jgi:hypothetical protein
MSKWSLRFAVIGAYALMSGMPAWGQWDRESLDDRARAIEEKQRESLRLLEGRLWLRQQEIEMQVWDLERRQRQQQIDMELNQPTRRR